jgi:AraC-like DNA-binding protein
MLPAGTIRIGGNTALPQVIRSLGFDPDLVVRAGGLDPVLLNDPETIVLASVVGKLYAHCAKATDCAHLGLLVGDTASLAWLGRIGLIARNAIDVASALAVIEVYAHYHDRSAFITMKKSNGLASLGYSLQYRMEGREQILSGVVAIGCSFLRELCGPRWAPAEVLLAIPKPFDTRPYETFFRSKVTFDAVDSAVMFDAAWLDCPIKGAERQLHGLLLNEINSALGLNVTDILSDVARTVRKLIGTGQCSAGQISAVLGMSSRTMHHRLRFHGVSVKNVIEKTRFELARKFLENTSMSLVQISERLDYSELSAFTRAFSRWSGMPPGRWRRNSRVLNKQPLRKLPAYLK